MGPNGSENFKALLLLQIATKRLKTVLNFPPNGPPKNTFVIFEILSFRFLTIVFFFFFFLENSKFAIVAYGEMKNEKPLLSGKGATVERSGVKFGPRGWIFSVCRVLWTVNCLRPLRGHSVYFRFSHFRKPCISTMAGHKAKRSEIWALGCAYSVYIGYF